MTFFFIGFWKDKGKHQQSLKVKEQVVFNGWSQRRAFAMPVVSSLTLWCVCCASQSASLSCPYWHRGDRTATGVNSIFRKFPLRTKHRLIKGMQGNQYFHSGCTVHCNQCQTAVLGESCWWAAQSRTALLRTAFAGWYVTLFFCVLALLT